MSKSIEIHIKELEDKVKELEANNSLALDEIKYLINYFECCGYDNLDIDDFDFILLYNLKRTLEKLEKDK